VEHLALADTVNNSCQVLKYGVYERNLHKDIEAVEGGILFPEIMLYHIVEFNKTGQNEANCVDNMK
jgi:hypothetical protein